MSALGAGDTAADTRPRVGPAASRAYVALLQGDVAHAKQELEAAWGAVPRTPTSDEQQVAVMFALEVLLDQAYHGGDALALAAASEAWHQAGYSIGSIDISHATTEEVLAAVDAAHRNRQRRLLRARANGLLQALRGLAAAGCITGSECMEARRLAWLARGGHDRT